MSQFEKWFKAQFRALPMQVGAKRKLVDEVQGLTEHLRILTGRVEEDDLLLARWDTAMKTRTAAPGFTF